jgi:hypothetical protein
MALMSVVDIVKSLARATADGACEHTGHRS